jgi:hypothetical protein
MVEPVFGDVIVTELVLAVAAADTTASTAAAATIVAIRL